MKLIIDMSLPPAWEDVLSSPGHDAIHWSKLGDSRAPDRDILAYASANGAVVVTHDLDFGAILAATGGTSPSVPQVRTLNPVPSTLGPMLLRTLAQFRETLDRGALIVLHEDRSRVRILPIGREDSGRQ